MDDDTIIEFARIEREALKRVYERMKDQQRGEVFNQREEISRETHTAE